MIFIHDLHLPEGPVALPDGSWLCVEDQPRGCITHINANGVDRCVIAVTGRPNGLAVDKYDNVWVAESMIPSLLKVSMAGEIEVVHTSCDGQPFFFPNDLCFGSDGYLYLTDSGITVDEFAPGGNIRPDYEQAPIDGRIYRIHPELKTIEKIDEGIRFTNGIAMGKGNYLYANETITGNIYRYLLVPHGVGKREFFGNVINPQAPVGFKGPDGMAFDTEGNLYVTVFGQQDVTMLNTEGSVAKRISTIGINPTNVAFALNGKKEIYVTEYEYGSMEKYQVDNAGLELWR